MGVPVTDTEPNVAIDLGKYQLGWSDEEDYVYKPQRGLNEDIIREMSFLKKEPEWMLEFRLRSYEIFKQKPMPNWGGDTSGIYFDDIYYYIKPTEGQVDAWEELPDSVKETYEKLGIPEAERKYLAGVTAQYESEVVYHRNREDLEAQGVIFSDMDSAIREQPELIQKYFGTIIPPGDNKFSALNSAVWSGGSFIYVPPGVEVEMPLQAYFRINAENMGQFERTLIIADEGATVHYIEGCSAPVYSSDSLHSAVVELVALPGGRITYTTVQNWSNNVFNLVTKRAAAYDEAHVEWIDGNIGSRLTMKYPAVYLMGPKASGEVLSVAYAGKGQHQDAGAKMVHAAPETTSKIVSKSISKDGGRTTYRGLVRVEEGMDRCRSHVQCDALLLDEISRSDTYPYQEIGARDAEIGHEATVSKVADEQLFYLMSRGLSEEQAMGMVVNGFIEPVTKTLPMEYAVEWSRLIELQMEGSIG
ncbi:MAG: Fe-S cluster assembly protein SufB [Actinobacteria bacterium]|uniref:Fe-S cluster assembly protein SufB n=1 Tax=marine metagenome TaxID=408172 RepID=A0A381PEF8_9ZZZZ|nr:Fe-S cluster assembly protein SufB [Actinomycetota bacterium]MEC8922298.1 Fe-S cluster assembly protein SufB [Actinomycetota bacterium]MEC9316483.1 Fe-S cluster assembly protein SufB [Actinomycetota bacterium]MED5551095.1 Fe-S cluster assembly protein SufB [Actinomycetota bacterium]MEE3140390.1 Fe-S cluster assembly protein SufB [Actinomycetota bacterium]|tara:strand:- start:1947 stop:3368 length:1422 start_codon:yes stop_codon:yes gene_type:complete